MRRILLPLFTAVLLLSSTGLFAQQKSVLANKVYQVSELLDDKFLNVEIKEYFVREIRKTELVKPIDNHEFVHFYIDRFESTYKSLIITELKKFKTSISQQQGEILTKKIIAIMADDFNVYRIENPSQEDNTVLDVNIFKLGAGTGSETEGAGQPCNNADFETGNCTGWDVITGTVPSSVSAPFSFTQTGTSTCGVSPNHVIMTGGNDAQGGFPRVFPGGGGTSLMLGDGTGSGNGAAKIRQTFLVDAGSAAFSYHYAVVLNDAGHTTNEQPYFKVNMYDAGGNPIVCADYSVTAPTGSSSDPNFISYPGGFYSNWRTAFAPLQGYIGTNVTIEFLVGDCSQGGHYGYAYIDASCDPLAIIPSQTVICGGQPVTLTAPAGATSYAWTPGGQTTQSITTNVPGHYEVFVTPVTGSACGLTLTADIGGSPDYPVAQATATPTTVCAGSPIAFNSTSYVVGTSAIDSVHWDFNSDGIIDNTTNSPNYTYPAAGSYTATLTVFNNGCQDDTTINITITPGTISNFTAPPVCVGVPTTFTNTSTPAAVVTNWNWDFDNNGTYDNTTQNPTYTFSAPGTYPVKLQVSGNAGACPDDTTINVVVYPKPNADFTATNQCLNTATTFVNNSNISSGTITGWSWDFESNGSVDNTTQTPTNTYGTAGTYNVTLIATSNNTCRDTANFTVEVYDNPVANFTTNTACENFATAFTNTSVQGDTTITGWQWDFDNNTTIDNTTQNPNNTYTSDGTFPVTLIVTDGHGCKDTVTNNVIVSPQPTSAFTFTNVCFGTTTGFTDVSNGNGGTINQWAWDFTNNGSVDNTTQNPTNGYTSAGSYTVELLVTTTAGCKDSITMIVPVDPIPAANFSGTNECLGTTTTFIDSSSVITGSIASWAWNFGDGSGTSVVQSPTYTYTSPGTYNVTLTVTSDSGCISNFNRNIQVYANPVAKFSTDTACNTYATSFTDLTVLGNTAIQTWGWDFNNDNSPDNSNQNPSFIFAGAGTYPVNLAVTDTFGCVHDTTINVTVSENPIAAFTFSDECFGISTMFTDQSNDNGGTTPIDTWEWDFENDGTVDDLNQNPTNLYGTAGTFTAELVVTSVLGCKDSTTVLVDVDAIPVANFGGTNECFGMATTFTDSSSTTIGNVVSWDWDFESDATIDDNNQNPTFVYPSAGIYNVTLTVATDSGCTHTFNTNVEVYANPVANFSTDTACNTYATSFTDLTAIGNTAIQTWGWDFDNNGSSDDNEQNPSFIFAGAGTYPVNLAVTDTFGCVHDTTINVTVSENPIANYTYSNECYGTGTVFTDLSNNNGGTTPIDTWEWDYDGNGTIDNTTQSPTYIFPAAGTYQTELYVTSVLGCKDSITIAVVVDPIPVANFSVTDVCLNFVATFIDSSTISTGSIASWDWDFGNGVGTSVLQNPTYTYPSAGTFNVDLTVTSDSGCTHNVVIPVTVNPKPTADFNVNNVCLNLAAPFTDASIGNGGTINQWAWDFTNNGSVDNTTQNPTNFYATAGTFNVQLVATTADGCKDTIVKPVTIHPMPDADFTFVNQCVSSDVPFTDNSTVITGTIDTWAWNFGDTQTSALEDPTNTYAVEGVYTVKLIVTTDNNCSDTIIKNNIEVWPLPVVNFGPTSVCLNNMTQFVDSSTVSNLYTTNTNTQWSWNFADGIGVSALQNPMYMYTTDGVFNATLIVTTNHNCVDSITKPVTVHPLPVVDFTPDIVSGCTPVCVTFTDNTVIGTGSTITQWDWDFTSDGIKDASNQNPMYCFKNPSHSSVRDYSIRLIATSNFGCKDTLTKVNYIHSNPIPLASFMYWPNDEASIVDNDITFTDQSIVASTWDWDLGDGATSNIQNPVHEYTDTGFYLVILRIENEYGCRDTTQKLVNIKPIYAIWIPNAFTPDGDFNNDFFYVDGYGIKELQVKIFDRWGLKIYDDVGVDQTWDGTYKGTLVPTDVYVYKIRAKDIFDEWHDYIGKVTVIK